MFPRFQSSDQLHGGIILPIAAIVFLGLLFPRTLAFSPGLAGLALFAFWPWLNPGPRPRPGLAMLAAIAITLFAAFSAFWSADTAYALERSGKVALVLIPGTLWILTLRKLETPLKRHLLHAVTITICLVAAFLIEELFFGYPLLQAVNTLVNDGEKFRDYDVNRSIVVLASAMLPVLAFARAPSSKTTFLSCVALAVLMLPVLAMTQSQSAQLAFITGLFFMTLFPVRCRLAWLGLAGILCAGILLAPFAAIFLFDMVREAGVAGERDSSWLNSANVLPRLEIWDFVSRYSLDHFWIGSGIEATRLIREFDSAELYQPGLTLLHPHNAVLQIWMEFGLLGAVLACAALSAVLLWIARQKDALQQRLSLGVLMAFGAGGAVSYGLWQGWWLGLIIFVTGLSALVPAVQEKP